MGGIRSRLPTPPAYSNLTTVIQSIGKYSRLGLILFDTMN